MRFTTAPGIYQIRSNINGKIYIGSSINLLKRRKSHIVTLLRNVHGNKHLQNHCNKYGIECLRFNVLEYCEIPELLSREQYYLDKYNPEFNICKIAGSSLGRKMTDSYKRKMRARKRKIQGTQTYQYDLKGNFIQSFKSRKYASKKTKININTISGCCDLKFKTAGGFIWTNGRTPSKKEIRNVGLMKTNKLINQYSLDGVFIKTHIGIKRTGRKFGINPINIWQCLSGRQKTASGFIWKFNE